MKLAIFEPSPFGHHMILYVRELVVESNRRDWKVTLVTTERALEHAATQNLIKDFGASLSIHLMQRVETENIGNSRYKLLLQQYRQYKAFQASFKQMRKLGNTPDTVFVPHLNYFDKILAWLKSPFDHVPFAGILQSIHFHQYEMGISCFKSKQNVFNRLVFMRLMKCGGLKRLFTTDESFYEWLKMKRIRYSGICLIPEFTPSESLDSVTESTATFMLKDPFIILIFGSICNRKGFAQLLRVLDDPQLNSRVVVQLGGRIESSLAEQTGLLRQRLRDAGRLKETIGVLDNAVQATLFCQADLVWVVYQGFMGMSGVLAQAILAETPVLACKSGLIGWVTRKHQIGKTLNPDDHQTLVRTINQLVDDKISISDFKRNMATLHLHQYNLSAPAIVLDELSKAIAEN